MPKVSPRTASEVEISRILDFFRTLSIGSGGLVIGNHELTAGDRPTAGQKRLTVLVCDGQELLREGLKSVLNKESSLEVVGEARNCKECIELARRLLPDVVILPERMAGVNGAGAVGSIAGFSPATSFVILTENANRGFFTGRQFALCLRKDASTAQLIDAVRAAGSKNCQPEGTRPAPCGRSTLEPGGSGQSPADLEQLTDREREVLVCLAEGYSMKEVAQSLGISVKTVDCHRSSLARKLGIRSRVNLVRYAIQKKLVAID